MEDRCVRLFSDLIYYYPEVIPELMTYLLALLNECDDAASLESYYY